MKKIECKRCGTCCIKGGPVLHSVDLALITEGVIRPDQLVVIRHGEPAYNPYFPARRLCNVFLNPKKYYFFYNMIVR